MRALCKDATKRYQTAAEMAADLRKTISHPEGGFVKYPRDPEEIEREKEERRRKRERDRRRLRRLVTAGVALIALLIIGVLAWYFSQTINTYVMPDLVGQEQLLAQDALEQLNGTVELDYSYSEDYEQGIVIGQSRRPGVRVKYALPVVLTVSRGTQWYYLEDVSGQRAEDAADALRAQGVENIEIKYIQSDAAVGTVVGMSPESGMQGKDTPVVLTVSGQRILMPSLTGLSAESAQALVEAVGLSLGEVQEGYAADALPDTVVAQSVAANSQVLAGTAVDITVNREQPLLYYPASKFSIVVPLNGSAVQLMMTAPSGEIREVYQGVLNAGTYRISLSSDEPGTHTVEIYMDGVLMERQEISFE